MSTYCSRCKKHTDNICPKKVIMSNKVIKEKSICGDSMASNKSFSDKIKHRSERDIIASQLLLN